MSDQYEPQDQQPPSPFEEYAPPAPVAEAPMPAEEASGTAEFIESGPSVGDAVSAAGLKAKLAAAFRGEEKLWKTFWVYGFGGSIILNIINSILTSILMLLGIPMMLVMLAFQVWSSIAIWRCAPNVKNKIWGQVARVLVVLSAIGFVLSLFTFVSLLFAGTPKAPTIPVAPMEMSAPIVPGAPTPDMAVPPGAPMVPPATGDAPMTPPPGAPVSPNAPMSAVPPQPAPVIPEAAPMVPPAPPVPVEVKPDACEQKLIDHANASGADAKAYVAQSGAWLAQCRGAK